LYILGSVLNQVFGALVDSFLTGGLALVEIIQVDLISKIGKREINHQSYSSKPDQKFQ
jgi:hypothetical protein